MSFYINNTNQSKPGQLSGNPMQGLCEKALIEVNKIFDACLIQTTEQGLILTVDDFNPANPTLPLTFISAESQIGNPATLSNLSITRLETRPNFANVSGTVTIPVIINYRDANGILGSGTTTLTKTFSTILYVPQPSLSTVDVTVSSVFASSIGTFTSPNIFTVTGCLKIIIKVVAQVDLLVPSYGYPCIPLCQTTNETQCPGISDVPIYPTALSQN